MARITSNSSTSTKFKKIFRIDPFFICVIAAANIKTAIQTGDWAWLLTEHFDPAK
jgi:hypothetical protein